jgi:hypothetical protein
MPFRNVIRLRAFDNDRSTFQLSRAAEINTANPIKPCRLFSVRDRIQAHRWIMIAGVSGYGKVVFERSEETDCSDPCEYLLIYRRDTPWAQWGVACRLDGYEVWHATRGSTIGVFPDLSEALNQILTLAG